MPACPFCQTELADDFGLIDCPGCDAALFIEMDGSVRAHSQQEEEPNPVSESSVDFDIGEQALSESEEEVAPEEMSSAEEFSEYEEEENLSSMDPSFMEDGEPDEVLQVSPQVEDPLDHEELSGLATAMDQQGAIEGLRYDLKISGIDSSDLRKEVHEALMDQKLGWPIEDIMKRMDRGTLELKGISAVKTHVLVQRLKVLPLQISWGQYADV